MQPALISQPGGSYAYTFGSAVVTTIRDHGFEWADVQNVGGKFLHGKQVSDITRDWTFTDSNTNSNWFAGIAANNSTYTSRNPPAPQGLQVGFITGNSSISQAVTLGSGQYQISFMAAPRGNKKQSNPYMASFVNRRTAKSRRILFLPKQ